MTGLFIAIFFTGFFVLLFVKAYQFGMKSNHEHLINDSRTIKFFVSLAVTGALVCYYLLRQYKFIYEYDTGLYWIKSFSIMKDLFAWPLYALFTFFQSLAHAEYNDLLPVIAALPLKILGCTFTRYVLVNYVCFFVPVCFILASLVKNKLDHNYGLFALFMAFTFTPLYRAMLVGYIDIACLVPASIALILMNDYDAKSFTREQVKRDVFISLMLVLTLMFRRYFVFYVIGYMSALGLLSLYQIRKNFALIKNAALNIIVIGLTALIIMLIFCRPFLFQVLGTNYADIYNDYNAPLNDKVIRVISSYGYFTFVLAGAGMLLSIFTEQIQFRKYVIFCAVSLIISAASFFHVQAMGIHQSYILAPQLFILSCSGVILAAKVIRSRKFITALCVLIFSAGYINCFFPSVRPVFSSVSSFFGSVHNNLIRNDIHVLNELADYVNSLNNNTDKKVYVLSTGLELNYSVMERLGEPETHKAVNNLQINSIIDVRDGYPVNFIDADIIITRSYNQPDPQKVISFHLGEIMKADSPIGRHFKKSKREFVLDNNVKVYVYEKQSSFDDADLQYIADYFTKIYPGREKIFADRIFEYMQSQASKSAVQVINRKSFVENNRPVVVALMKWILQNKLAAPEHLAKISHREPEEFYELMSK